FSIFHFDSPQKPWNFPDYPFADLFWRYARNTIFYEEAIKQMNMNTVKNNIDLLRLLGNIGNGKIAVYGAGSYGKAFIDAIRYMSAFKIVAWVDKNYQNKTGLRIPVYPVEMLDEIDFDKLVVAIYDDKVFDEIKKMLISHGIEESKICRYK
ncbi:MAG: hypothetical protein IJ784_05415, partial [Ruminiclostridium sp.]|nr:hypothetical protein [Ruminiclostridium sp.]